MPNRSRLAGLRLRVGSHILWGMPDDSIAALTEEIQAFCQARDWHQFHAPKELAVAIAAEAGELLQHFVWQTSADSERRALERKDEIASEIADVAILLFELVWKLVWLTSFGFPQWSSGVGSPRLGEDLWSIGAFPVVCALVIPWGYVWRHYVKAPGDRWR